jgi:hypothetical protein
MRQHQIVQEIAIWKLFFMYERAGGDALHMYTIVDGV